MRPFAPIVAAVLTSMGLLVASAVTRGTTRRRRMRKLVGLPPAPSKQPARHGETPGSGDQPASPQRFAHMRFGAAVLIVVLAVAAGVPSLRSEVLGLGFVLALLQVGLQLHWRARERVANQRLMADLPHLLELVTVCSTGGLSLNRALHEAVNRHDGPAGRYFRTLLKPTEAGLDLGAALKRGVVNGQTGEIRSVCRTLLTAFVLGVPAAETLSELSDYVARRRRQGLEEKIRTLPLRLTMISVLLLLPPVVVLVVLPNVAAFLLSQW